MRTRNYRNVGVGMLLGFLLLLLVGMAFAETLLVRETFCEPEGGIPDGWKATMNEQATVAIRQVPALAAPTCGAALELADQSASTFPMLERSFDGGIRKGAFEYVVLNSTDMPGEISGDIRADGVGNVIDCRIDTARSLKCRDGSTLKTLATGVEYGVWHTVRIEWDTTTWTYRVKLNGADVTPEAGFRFTAQAVPSSVRFRLGSAASKVNQKAYIDQALVVAY